MKKLVLLFTLLGILFATTSIPVRVYAQTSLPTCTTCSLGYTPLEPVPGLTSEIKGDGTVDTSFLTNPKNLPTIINYIFKIFITVGALFAVLSLTIGGVQYMVSESAGGKNRGIERAKAALWAILLVAATWLILHTINPNLLNFTLDPCPQSSLGCTVTSSASNSTTGIPNTSALGLNSQEQQNIQNNIANPDAQTCTDAKAAVQNPGFVTSLGLMFGVQSVVQKDQIIRTYINNCAAAGF